jgi:D-beta-D-heptose 7-phosphate kinase/D-beta-D-heptose 1-phosphate adenosyltransferase
MDQKDLISAIENFAEVRVLCAGDVMLDYFVYGDIERISPEAPVPVVRVHHEECMLGGAGNVVRNLASLGAAVSFVSLIGDGDSAGEKIGELLAALPNVRASLIRDPARRTSVKTRYLAQSQQVLRVDAESTEPAGASLAAQILQAFEGFVRDCDVVILSDYGKGVLAGDSPQRLIQAARAAGKPVLVDPKGRDYKRYAQATIVKPNRKELAEATGMPVTGDAAVEQAAKHLMPSAKLKAMLVTLGSAGMLLVTRDGPARAYRSAAREVFDVSGAGDTVIATLAAGVGSGLKLEHASDVANLAAGLVVSKIGTAVVTREQLIHELESRHPSAAAADSKVMVLDEAVQRANRWRRQGLRIGFTNGCFDLLHAGHITLLRKARERCDRLVLAINTDSSVLRLKGPGRPAQDERTRALVLASLAPVDLVVLFDEDTPERLIRELRPDVLVKGADYRPEEVVGADLVASWGGELLLVDLVPGHSTTRTMQKLASQAK